ncbi:MAG: nucleoside 2-deoxyribosyltransferase [Verrucomicrobia bacterium]|nr:MAG: nucleoside 2-deoxyribosyltransferase [Verrucomicrobiota bacterium]
MPGRKSTLPSRTVYFAGELFSAKHLLGNACLAEAIHQKSRGRYLSRLPQDFELRGTHPHLIRDTDLRALLECDLAVFNFDGPELDSGTVVEFMSAKFADLPCVIVRSDFRAAGDQGPGRDPWNLMASFYPRTVSVPINALALYKKAYAAAQGARADDATRLAHQYSSLAAKTVCEQIAQRVVRGLDRAAALSPALPAPLREDVYRWLALMPGFRGAEKNLRDEFSALLAQKVQRGLL